MATDEADTTRARIQTYVPEFQKQEWERHAGELDMSLSEFVRSMVQAGRRGFEEGTAPTTEQEPPGSPSSASEPQGKGLEDRVLECLSNDECVDWDELVAELTGDIEDRLDETLRELQEEGTIRYSGRDGGYVLE